MSVQDIGQYVNYVTVQLRKRHAGGKETQDEVLIDRNTFNTQGNAFRLLYGWDGDNDRRRWMDYEYRTICSFFGDRAVDVLWTATSANFHQLESRSTSAAW